MHIQRRGDINISYQAGHFQDFLRGGMWEEQNRMLTGPRDLSLGRDRDPETASVCPGCDWKALLPCPRCQGTGQQPSVSGQGAGELGVGVSVSLLPAAPSRLREWVLTLGCTSKCEMDRDSPNSGNHCFL